jgi:hypothetical protein
MTHVVYNEGHNNVVMQELITLPENLSSIPHVTQS